MTPWISTPTKWNLPIIRHLRTPWSVQRIALNTLSIAPIDIGKEIKSARFRSRIQDIKSQRPTSQVKGRLSRYPNKGGTAIDHDLQNTRQIKDSTLPIYPWLHAISNGDRIG